MSWQARIAILKARLRRDKEFYSNAEYMRRHYPAHQTADHVKPPKAAFTTNEITQTEIDGFPCYTLHPNAPWSGLHIFHLHGGGFVEGTQDHHWGFAAWMARTLRCKYSLFMYPLAPQHDHSTIVPSTLRAFDHVMGDVPQSQRILFGDSAGGSLSLGIAQELRDTGQKQPACIALFSPWLNMAVDHELSAAIEPYDPELGIEGLKQAGSWYAGDRELNDAELSPEYADLSGVAPLSIFVGTRDILLPDSIFLHTNAQRSGTTSSLNIYYGMFHNWIMQPLPKAREARSELTAFVRKHAGPTQRGAG